MIMNATVLEVFPNRLLVFDHATSQEVLVHTRAARRFSIGNQVRITHNGVMTLSLPPQITATSVVRVNRQNQCCFPAPLRALLCLKYGIC